ncbi:c-type cytochrome [Acetobacter estunensis]|uniref:c-type cytochrome n=1 Tax=Acetobacter estunensis TaxID=104097 RepID=UPI001C2D0A7A|nr:c-type cytochrome [Acetobacter estunensis]MBV1837204.1 c-type cytochrome [Acetobacter estunensis]
MPEIGKLLPALLVAGTMGSGSAFAQAQAPTPLAPTPTTAVPASSPAPSPDQANDPELARGAYIATAADCVACHTASGGKPFAGGLKISTPMGDVVSTNITPDPEHGIGKYSEKDFEQAVRHGVRRDGSNLFPVMPYVSYAGMTDQDVQALYAWFMHKVEPVPVSPPEDATTLPAGMRSAMMAWNYVTTMEKPETGDSGTFDPVRRGRYLVNALEHCGTCHTPRNFMLSEKQDRFLSGASLTGWYAPNVTSSKTSGIGSWSEDDIVTYLRTGRLDGHAQAAGPMAEAVEHSLSHLTESDLHAIATYLLQVPAMEDDLDVKPRDSFGKPQEVADIRHDVLKRIDDLTEMDGADIYDANCAACHGHDGAGTRNHYAPSLFNNTTVGSARPDNLIMTILKGVDRTTKDGHALMPGFGATSDVERLTDTEIASLVNYLTATFGSGDHHVTAQQVADFRNAK